MTPKEKILAKINTLKKEVEKEYENIDFDIVINTRNIIEIHRYSKELLTISTKTNSGKRVSLHIGKQWISVVINGVRSQIKIN